MDVYCLKKNHHLKDLLHVRINRSYLMAYKILDVSNEYCRFVCKCTWHKAYHLKWLTVTNCKCTNSISSHYYIVNLTLV